MIRYLSTALDNNSTLDWEDLLPVMAMCYNCHVQRATQESPFFLTYLHFPRLPYFDLENPRKLYGENYVSDAYFWKLCKENLQSAKKARETYFNRRAKRREFSIGDEVLVKFPKVPRVLTLSFSRNGEAASVSFAVLGHSI